MALVEMPLCGGHSAMPYGGGAGFLGPDAMSPEWAQSIPLHMLPSLPQRGPKYFTEPITGLVVVVVVSALLIGLTILSVDPTGLHAGFSRVILTLIWTWALVAAGCVGYLFFGDPGEIKRSPNTCYPIPVQVAESLTQGLPMDHLRNIEGPFASSYCVRCLVWRSGDASSGFGFGHHCNTCQRCVSGFDHHCNVFGRCIASGNLPFFYGLIGMLIAGVVTTGAALVIGHHGSTSGMYSRSIGLVAPEYRMRTAPAGWGSEASSVLRGFN